MPWFVCGDCGDTIKKPKVAAHAARCPASALTCVDCSRDFDRWSVRAHVSCVTEHDKYAKGATKPGGIAANGYYEKDEGGNGAAFASTAAATACAHSGGGENGVEGVEHLSSLFPWKCHLCNVTCTSQETLLGHASGLKHRRRARAAAKNKRGGGDGEGNDVDNNNNIVDDNKEEGEKPAAATVTNTSSSSSPSTPPQQKGSLPAAEPTPSSSKKKDEKKKKKRKQEEEAEEKEEESKSKKKKTKAQKKSDDGKPPKWKELALSVLSESASEKKKKKGIKVSKLVEAVLRAAGVSSDDDATKKQVVEALEGSSKFRVEGGRVALAK